MNLANLANIKQKQNDIFLKSFSANFFRFQIVLHILSLICDNSAARA